MDFKAVSKSLLTIHGQNGKYALAVVVSFGDDQLYAVTTQSVFLSGILSCKFRDFGGHNIRGIRVEVASNKDLIRVPIVKNDFIEPLKITGDPKIIYEMNPFNGVIIAKKFQPKLFAVPGSIVFSRDGLAGFVSVVKGYVKPGQQTVSFVKIDNDVKWKSINFTKFIAQCRSLSEMCAKTLSLEHIVRNNKMNQFMVFQPEFSESHIKWVKDHNKQYEKYFLNPNKSGKSMGAAKLHHESRCIYYAGLRGLSCFSFNITKNIEITKWFSTFLKKSASMIAKRSKRLDDQLKVEMKKMVKDHPATKAKF
jgi:hypothetical protein